MRRLYRFVGTRLGNIHRFPTPTWTLCWYQSNSPTGSGRWGPKPLGAWKRILQRVSPEPSDVVLDPFMGVGTTLVAAKYTGRRVIGIEIEERFCEAAATRLTQQAFDFEEAS